MADAIAEFRCGAAGDFVDAQALAIAAEARTPGRVASDAFTVKTLAHSIADFRLAGATGELAASFGPGRFFEKVTLTRVEYSMVLPLWWNSINVSYSGG
jgi:hypothetical protein